MEKIPIEEVRSNIVQKIASKYNMTISQFCRSGIPEKWDINAKTLPSVLSTGNSSFRVLEILYRKLNMGTLTKEVKVTKKLSIFVDNKKSIIKKPKPNGKEKHQVPN